MWSVILSIAKDLAKSLARREILHCVQNDTQQKNYKITANCEKCQIYRTV